MKIEREIRDKYFHVWADGIVSGFDLPESAYESVWDIVKKVALWTQDSTPTPEPTFCKCGHEEKYEMLKNRIESVMGEFQSVLNSCAKFEPAT